MIYRRRPEPPIRAIQWNGTNLNDIVEFGATVSRPNDKPLQLWGPLPCQSPGEFGWINVPLLSWIIDSDASGDYPVDTSDYAVIDQDGFAATYEPTE